mmetsp:Transcript_58380/g.162739  ORF Transcript_58380/g.162739 Transcript_58380/m.162739 type:complete len:304 (+) Transcript_58380:651-1562(+)
MASMSSWSACLNSLLSLLRIFKASSISALVLLIASSREAISSVRSPAVFSMRWIAAEAFPIAWSRSSISFLFLFVLPWQRSRCSMSSCSSRRRTPIMSSIAAMTASKWPPASARAAMLKSFAALVPLCILAAACRSLRLAMVPRRWPKARVAEDAALAASTCSSVVVAFLKVLIASGLESTSMACPMPWSSSVRRRERSAQCMALSLQAAVTSVKSSSSTASCACVSSRSCLLTERSLLFLAPSALCASSAISSVLSSLLFVAMSSWKPFSSSASSALAFSNELVNASYRPLRMPWMRVDCGA